MLEGRIGKNLSFASPRAASAGSTFFLPHLHDRAAPSSRPIYYDYQAQAALAARRRATTSTSSSSAATTSIHVVARVDADPALFHEFDSHTYFHRILSRWLHRFACGATLTVTPSVGYDVPFEFKAHRRQRHLRRTPTPRPRVQRCAPSTTCRSARSCASTPASTTKARATRSTRGSPSRGLSREGDTGDFLGYRRRNPGGARRPHDARSPTTCAPFVALTIALVQSAPAAHAAVPPRDDDLRRLPEVARRFNRRLVLPEPRLARALPVVRAWRCKAAVGVYHQAPDPADFSRVVRQPDARAGVRHPLRRSASTSSRRRRCTSRSQGFYKDLRNLVVRGAQRRRSACSNEAASAASTAARSWCGRSCGRTSSAGSRTRIMRSERQRSSGRSVAPVPVRPDAHPDLLGSYKLPRGFQVGLRFRYVTGNPYTPVVARLLRRQQLRLRAGLRRALLGAAAGSFNQLDLRVDKTFAFNAWKLTLYLDIQNIYNSTSAEGFAYSFDFKQRPRLTACRFCRCSAREATSDARALLVAALVCRLRRTRFDPASFVDGLRLLGVQSRAARGRARRHRDADRDGRQPRRQPPTITWDACLLPPPPATGQSVNQDCVALPEAIRRCCRSDRALR